MNLNHTKELIERLYNEQTMDACALHVQVAEQAAEVFTPGTDRDTLFDIASMGKILVTTPLILKAVSESRLRLTDTLGELYADTPEDKKGITVQQLLTHTSGVMRYEYPREVGLAGHDTVRCWILDTPLGYAPGKGCAYSCNGMMLLGFVLETLYGKGLDELYREKLKAPLGLTRSEFNISLDTENAAVCYHRRDAGESRADDINVRNIGGVSGAGGEYWTLRDICAFAEATRAKSPLLYAEKLFELAEMDYAPDGVAGRGLGWLYVDERYPQTGRLFPSGSFGHTGFTGTSLFLNREVDMYVSLLTNSTRFACLKNDFKPGAHEAEVTHEVRRMIHEEIRRDLIEQKMI